MLILAVLGLLVAASLTILLSHALKPNVSRAWVIALVATTIAWVAVLILRLYLPTEVNLVTWEPVEIFNGQLGLVLDYQSWPFAVALITLCMATIFTDTTQTNLLSSPFNWAGSITITLINLIGILAGDPLTLALAWSLVDLVEFFYLLHLGTDEANNRTLVTSYAIRLISIMTLVAATVVGWQTQPNFTLHQIPASAAWIFLLAASFRLGTLPLKLPLLNSQDSRQGIAVLLRFAPVASALILISHLNALPEVIGDPWLGIFRGLTVFFALYSSLMFATRAIKFQSLTYWIVALSAFTVRCVLNGAAQTTLVWGLALLLGGAMLYLFDPPIRRIRFLPLLGLIGLVGLPFTPAASGWDGLIGSSLDLSLVAMVLAHAMLVAGFLRYIFEANTTITALEKHARITFPMGLVLILQTILILGVVGWPGVLTIGRWWLPLISLALVGLIVLASIKLGLKVPFTNLEQRLPFYRVIQSILTWLQSFSSLNWLHSGVEFLGHQVGRLTIATTELIEGEGGLLWSLVLLIAMITIFVSAVKLP